MSKEGSKYPFTDLAIECFVAPLVENQKTGDVLNQGSGKVPIEGSVNPEVVAEVLASFCSHDEVFKALET
jgi:hypothetical protein